MKKSDPVRPVRKDDVGHADAHGDFYYDELMTPQPDATREFYRSRLEAPVPDRTDPES